ncbi:MAG: T9SS type A sorting domain-containing protein [Bacteroidetes bacterium]|nr:T9SS type A sorting domain-containing protein [Bacteroidota bacterium]HET6243431.1 T9SS type A sorting domain-containing protein [Bacteroidia bacterium]
MKNIYLSFCLILLIPSVFSATLYSRANGPYGTTGTWSIVSHVGPSCSCIPNNNDIVIIGNGNNITFSTLIIIGSGNVASLTVNTGSFLTGNGTSDIEIKTGGTLNIGGTVTTRNISFANGSIINVESTGVLIVTGNLTNNNNSSNVTFNGAISVSGNFNNGNGGDISGNGSLSVEGTINNTGTTFGCSGSNCCEGNPCTFSITLPIELLSFEAFSHDNSIVLKWVTASETNNDFFTIEKTTDGIEFTEVHKLKAAGNSRQIISYSQNDLHPFPGLSYYRLKQTDYDGKFSFSDLVAVNFDKKEMASFSVFPNPAPIGSALNILIAGELNKEILIVVVDMSGREYYSKVIVLDNNKTVVAIDPYDRLPSGVYLITGSMNNDLYNKKLIVR